MKGEIIINDCMKLVTSVKVTHTRRGWSYNETDLVWDFVLPYVVIASDCFALFACCSII